MWNRFLWEKGILEGGKGDIMIPNISMKEQQIIIFSIMKMQRCLKVMIFCFAGPMVTVLGTSLQNRDLLKFFMNQLGVIGLEMEGLSESHPVSLENKKKSP
jgi:hypothetical protein